MFSSKNYNFSIFILVFELIFVYGIKRGLTSFFYILRPVVPATFVKETHLSLIVWSWHPYQNSTDYRCAGLFLGSQFSLIYISILLPVTHCFDFWSFVISFEIEKCASSNFVLFFKIVLAIQDPLKFHMDLRVSFFISATIKGHCNLGSSYCVSLVMTN